MEGLVFILAVLSLWVGSSSAVGWPCGTYSMITPKSGCPSGWKWGWRYQDNEDTGNVNSMTSYHHFNGFFFDDTIHYYCSKTSYSGSGSWPRGNYCIMRYGSSCPPGKVSIIISKIFGEGRQCICIDLFE
eukprot:XP_011424360.1 PREDICTED: uncharacterized protein LOC105326187 [Crassostrea gigas]